MFSIDRSVEKRVVAHFVQYAVAIHAPCRLRRHTKLEGTYPCLRIVFANQLAVHFEGVRLRSPRLRKN